MEQKGPGQSGEVEQCKTHEVQQGQMKSPAPGSGQCLVSEQSEDGGMESSPGRRTWGAAG